MIRVVRLMKHSSIWAAGCAAVLVIGSGVPVTAAPAAAPASVRAGALVLRKVDLGSGQALFVAGVYAMNDLGQILGGVDYGEGDRRGVIWSRYDRPIEINTPDSAGMRLGNRGDVMGFDWYWNRGRTQHITDSTRVVSAMNMNDHGQVVGSLWPQPPGPGHVAFMWQNGRSIELPTPPGMISDAEYINNRGEVVGTISYPDFTGSRSVIWRNAVMTTIDVPNDDETRWVTGLNDRGQVLINSGGRPYVWHRGRLTDLLADRPHATGEASGINNAGDIVVNVNNRRLVMYRGGRQIPLTPPERNGWRYYFRGMNDHGDVFGIAQRHVEGDGPWQDRVFLWQRGRFYLSSVVKTETGGAAPIGIDERGRITGAVNDFYDQYPAHSVVWIPAGR